MAHLAYRGYQLPLLADDIRDSAAGIHNSVYKIIAELRRRPDDQYLRQILFLVLVDAFDLVFRIEYAAAEAAVIALLQPRPQPRPQLRPPMDQPNHSAAHAA